MHISTFGTLKCCDF